MAFFLDAEIEFSHHNGTVRDLIFMRDNQNDDSMLLSGGAGDCKIYLTDVQKKTPISSFNGHQGKVKTHNQHLKASRRKEYFALYL